MLYVFLFKKDGGNRPSRPRKRRLQPRPPANERNERSTICTSGMWIPSDDQNSLEKEVRNQIFANP